MPAHGLVTRAILESGGMHGGMMNFVPYHVVEYQR